MKFRLANNDDMPVLLELLDMLFEIETDFTFDAEAARCGFELMLQDTERSAISTAIGARSIWVEDVIVRPEYRGQSLMPRLLGELEKWGRERGVKRSQNLCDLHNAPALSFYSKRSQRTELICFVKLLN